MVAMPKAWLRVLAFVVALMIMFQFLFIPRVDLPANPKWTTDIWDADDCARPYGYWPFSKQVQVTLQGCLENPHYRKPSWYKHLLPHMGPGKAGTAMEIGIDKGDTTETLADTFAETHVFDFEDRAKWIKLKIGTLRAGYKMKSYGNIVVEGNSHALRDSYTYTLKELLKLPPSERPTFDFVYLDGAHEWHHDGLAFLLIDLMLRPGGVIEFDDYWWTIKNSPTVNPTVHPTIKTYFTDQQIEEAQVKELVDLLCEEDPHYTELGQNSLNWHKIYRKDTGAPLWNQAPAGRKVAQPRWRSLPLVGGGSPAEAADGIDCTGGGGAYCLPAARAPTWYAKAVETVKTAVVIGGTPDCLAVVTALLKAVGDGGRVYLLDSKAGKTASLLLPQGVGGGEVVPMPYDASKSKDSYTYGLKQMLRSKPRAQLDYVYIDGEHEWHRDGFSFLLTDKMLRVGGMVEFAGYDIKMEDTNVAPELFTEKQHQTAQINEVVDLLVANNPKYELVDADYHAAPHNRLFKKKLM